MRIPGWLFTVGVVLFVGLTGLCAVVSFSLAHEVALQTGAATGGDVLTIPQLIGTSVAQVPPTPTPPLPTPTPTLASDQTTQLTPSGPTPTLDPLSSYGVWDDPRSINILLLGVDQRTAVSAESNNTDTIMVVHLDPARRSIGVLSIPRDLWVDIPGYTTARINTAYTLGEGSDYPGGGAALAAATVAQNLGIRVENYILINFNVFTAVVDTLAPQGIEICVSEVIDDPDYPDAGFGTIPVRFEPGCQPLNAERLLQYARTRATYGGDFDRARRQQQVLQAARDEFLSAGGIANFITQIPTLWQQLSGSFSTNLSMEELIQLALLVQDIPRESIRFGTIDERATIPGTSADGTQEILIPLQSQMRFVIQQVFSPQEDLTLDDLRIRAEAENASIVVYNNTDITGLAGQMREWLISRGLSITEVGNMPAADNANTTIRDYTGRPWTARYLAALLGLGEDRITSGGGDGLTSADVMIVVGPDIQPLLSGG
ncbi:MAG: LCP family protein [Chloroflexi bacterium]|nr:LCP family protein [Chloroflexota bacterium]